MNKKIILIVLSCYHIILSCKSDKRDPLVDNNIYINKNEAGVDEDFSRIDKVRLNDLKQEKKQIELKKKLPSDSTSNIISGETYSNKLDISSSKKQLDKDNNCLNKKNDHSRLYNSLSHLDKETIKANLIGFILTKRGIATCDCKWWNLTDNLYEDKTAVNLAHKISNKQGNPKLSSIYLLGKEVYGVSNKKYLKEILDNSPDIFGAGADKSKFLKTFMEKNVGISHDSDWYNRRKHNEAVLDTNKIPRYANEYKNFIKKEFEGCLPKNFKEFNHIGERIVSKVVFNDPDGYPEEIYKIFAEANKITAIFSDNFKISDKTMNKYLEYLNKNIDNPKPKSLVKLANEKINYCPVKDTHCREEIINQIPHWLFPTLGAFNQVIPRTLLFLSKHPKKLKILEKEILKMKNESVEEIYNLRFLRYCILESLRLNPLSFGVLRTLRKDFTFHDNTKYKKGKDFLIFFSVFLRDPEVFPEPNKFIPERWEQNTNLENSYNTMMFSHGPQMCPGKEKAISLMMFYIVYYLKKLEFNITSPNKIDNNNITQMVNPCSIKFY